MVKYLFRLFSLFPINFKIKIIRLLLKIKRVEVKIAQTPREKEESYIIRWQIYSQEGYIDPKDYPDRKLVDKYDVVAINFLAKKNGKILGTVRLIPYSSLGFPTLNAFNITNFPAALEKTAEISKLCIKKEYRDKIITFGLLGEAFLYSINKGIKYWIFGIPEKLKRHFEKVGIKIEKLPTKPPQSCHLKERKTAEKYFLKHNIYPFITKLET